MDQKLRVIVSADTSGLLRGVNQASSKLKSFGGKLSDIGSTLSTRLSLPLSIAGGSAIKMASDFEESLNKVDVAFGSSSNHVKDFAKTTLKQFGIAEGSTLEMSALFGDMATGMGIARDDASLLSTSMVGLAGDLASFKNINIEEVTTALSGVFTGETESLKRLGIVMTEVNLKQFAMEQGIKKNIKEMTQAEKINLRYQFILSKTENAQGDFARTSEGSANQMRIFQESLKELGQTFGKEILPLFTSAVTKANDIIQKFKNFDDQTKKIVMTIGLLTAGLPLLITAFGKLSIVVGAIISPIGLFVTLISAVTIATTELLYQLNPVTDRLTTFINFIKSAGDPTRFFALQTESLAKKLHKEKTEQEKSNLAKQKSTEYLNSLKLGYDGLSKSIDNTGRKLATVSNSITSVGLQGFDTEGATASEDINILDNSLQKINNRLRLSESFAVGFGQSLMGIFETIGEGEPFFKQLMDMLGKLIKKLITAAIVSGALALGIGAIFPGAGISFGSLFGALSGIGDISGLSGRSALGSQSFIPKSISPSRSMGRLNANRTMMSNQLSGDFRLQGQDLILALQRANKTRNRIIG